MVMAKPWHGFRETLNCGHFQLTDSGRRIGQVTACWLCPLNIHNLGSPGVPVAAVRVPRAGSFGGSSLLTLWCSSGAGTSAARLDMRAPLRHYGGVSKDQPGGAKQWHSPGTRSPPPASTSST